MHALRGEWPVTSTGGLDKSTNINSNQYLLCKMSYEFVPAVSEMPSSVDGTQNVPETLDKDETNAKKALSTEDDEPTYLMVNGEVCFLDALSLKLLFY